MSQGSLESLYLHDSHDLLAADVGLEVIYERPMPVKVSFYGRPREES